MLGRDGLAMIRVQSFTPQPDIGEEPLPSISRPWRPMVKPLPSGLSEPFGPLGWLQGRESRPRDLHSHPYTYTELP